MDDTEFGFEFLLHGQHYDVTIRVSDHEFTLVERDGLPPRYDSVVLMEAQELLMDAVANAPLSDTRQ